ncbi:MAG: hypothetical protein ACE361_08195 [Aureliella sp.]
MRSLKFLAPCLLLLAASANQAQAQQGCGIGLSYLYGYNGFNNYSATTYNRSVPYFSLHPPVYYGKRYTRPYGASPFAAWPQLQANSGYAPAMGANLTQVRPLVITNPYMPGHSPAGGTPGVVKAKASGPVTIENPYFRDAKVQYTSAE